MYNARMKSIVPKDTRYIPLTQQKRCCVAACIQMIMLRHNIPLVPCELIADSLGLIVPAEETKYFMNPRTGKRPPAGWGTQMEKSEFDCNLALKKLGIPLSMSFISINEFKNTRELYSYLLKSQNKDRDNLFCFDWGILHGKGITGGHDCVFDMLKSKTKVRIIDPEYLAKKWQVVSIQRLFKAMKMHCDGKEGGLLVFKRIKS